MFKEFEFFEGYPPFGLMRPKNHPPWPPKTPIFIAEFYFTIKTRAKDIKNQLRYSYFKLEKKDNFFLLKERCHAKFLEGILNKLGLLIGPNKTVTFVKKAA